MCRAHRQVRDVGPKGEGVVLCGGPDGDVGSIKRGVVCGWGSGCGEEGGAWLWWREGCVRLEMVSWGVRYDCGGVGEERVL